MKQIATLASGLTLLASLALAEGPAGESDTTADHTRFEALKGPFASGPDVTEACLSCHTEAAKQVHDSIHWTWEFANPETGQTLGKRPRTSPRSRAASARPGGRPAATAISAAAATT